MNSYIQNNLQSDEKLKMKAEINKIALIIPIIAIILDIIIFFGPFMTYLNSNSYEVSIGITILAVLLFIIVRSILETIKVLIYISTSVLAFTNKRVISKKGLLNVKILDSPIDKINDFDIRQSLFGRIFNYSKVIIKTSSSIYFFDYVKDAAKFKNMLITTDRVQKVEIQENSQNTNNKYDELDKLKELLDKDIITKEEFDKKKKELLNL